MAQILKWNLGQAPVAGACTVVELPEGAIIITGQMTLDGPCIWTLSNSEKKEKRYFISVTTGNNLPDWIMDARHVCTMHYMRASKIITGKAHEPKVQVDHVFELPAHLAMIEAQ